METPLVLSHTMDYLFVKVDNHYPPTIEQMIEIMQFIKSHNKTLIHCKGGVGRTATAMACYLTAQDVELEDILQILSKRKTIMTKNQEIFIKTWKSHSILSKKLIKIKTPLVIMMVGLPASGKSTMAKILNEQAENVIVISQDELRSKSKNAKEECMHLFSINTKKSQLVVVLDRCNPTKEERKEWIKLS
jgi:atypical dual specificity phosphatase